METAIGQKSAVRGSLIAIVFILSALIVFGVVWLFLFAPADRTGFGWYLFSFATGLTMIVLPCTLPLAFVIVPLSMGKGVKKGLGIAFSFGLGIAITLSLYGVLAAIVGKTAIGGLNAPLETVKNWVYFIAGIFAYLFALGEVGLIKFHMPTYTGAAPAFIQKQQDFLKALLLGLFLGNIGVGCPHPATPLLLVEIASSGNIFYGWTLFLVHALGRVLPLLLLAILGIAGVNGLSWLVARKDKIERATGWAMVFVAGFILVLGLFTHDWWVNSGIHTQLESFTQEERLLNILGAKLGTGNAHHHGFADGSGLFALPLALGSFVLVLLWLIPMWWWWIREREHVVHFDSNTTPELHTMEEKLLGSKKWSLAATSVILILLFIYILPHRFLDQTNEAQHDDATSPMHMVTGAGGHSHTSQLHEETDVTDGAVVNLRHGSEPIVVERPTNLEFVVNEKPSGKILDDLEIDHEKLMHVIGVRSDLSNFFHVHPKKIAPGRFMLSGVFYEPGTYKLWSDIMRNGERHSFGHPTLTVTSPSKQAITESIPPNFGTTNVTAGYTVIFDRPQLIGKGQPTRIGFTIHDSVGTLAPLKPYLGASMHLAVISQDLTSYIHSHPLSDDMHAIEMGGGVALAGSLLAHGDEVEMGAMHVEESQQGSSNSQVSFDVVFPKSGVYKLFAQFSPQAVNLGNDESLVSEFYVTVGDKSSPQPATTAGGSSAVGQSAKVSKGVLVFISLVLMSLLSFVVKKYLSGKRAV